MNEYKNKPGSATMANIHYFTLFNTKTVHKHNDLAMIIQIWLLCH